MLCTCYSLCLEHPFNTLLHPVTLPHFARVTPIHLVEPNQMSLEVGPALSYMSSARSLSFIPPAATVHLEHRRPCFEGFIYANSLTLPSIPIKLVVTIILFLQKCMRFRDLPKVS